MLANSNSVDASDTLSIKPHEGAFYQQFLQELTGKRLVHNYLEIGVLTGQLLSKINAKDAYAVDPNFNIEHNVAANKDMVFMFQGTSDQFFSGWAGPVNGGKLDFAVLDGMHTFEYLLRDFYNTEMNCHAGSLIAMHDCLPLNAAMASRKQQDANELGRHTPHPGWWTGDVWKIIPIIQKFRPDLKIICVDAPPTGLVFVTNLNPQNSVLRDSYREIVDEFRGIPNDDGSIRKLYDSIEIVSTKEILNEFDHSLFFNV